MRQTSQIAAAAIFPIIALATPAPAHTVATILTFAESGVNPPSAVLFTDNGNGTTSLSTDVGVTISAIAGPLGPTAPITDATYMLTGMSTDAAATETIGGISYYFQKFSGTFSVDDPACGIHGVCLDGSWKDLLTGPVNGFALALAASDPPVNGLSFFSDTIPLDLLGLPISMSLAKTALTNPVTLDCASSFGCTLASTAANVSGTFSAGAIVPEPSTWAMMGLGFAGLGFVGYRKAKSGQTVVSAA